MSIRAGKTQKNKNQDSAPATSRTQRGGPAGIAHVADPPGAMPPTPLQALADNSSRVQQMKAFHALANSGASGRVVQRVITKVIDNVTVTFADTGGYPTWDMDGERWHINTALGENDLYHVTKEASPKVHYFFTLSAGSISDAVAPREFRGRRNTKKKFSALPSGVQAYIKKNIGSLM